MIKYNRHRNLRANQRQYVSKGPHKGKEIIPARTPLQPVVQRTNESFRDRDQPFHHIRKSLFEYLDVDMIETFTIDGMHTVFIGVAKRFLHFLCGDSTTRVHRYISDSRYKLIGAEFANTKFPREFSRPPRPLSTCAQWKATELRMYILYGGDIIMSLIP